MTEVAAQGDSCSMTLLVLSLKDKVTVGSSETPLIGSQLLETETVVENSSAIPHSAALCETQTADCTSAALLLWSSSSSPTKAHCPADDRQHQIGAVH